MCGDGPTDDDGFDIDAARVVCRQLGVEESGELLVHSIIDKCTNVNRDDQLFSTDLTQVVTNIFFGGDTTQPIHLDTVQCTGTETNLLNCSHDGIGVHDCGHPEDIGIICRPSQGLIIVTAWQQSLPTMTLLFQLLDCRDGDVRLVDRDNYNATSGRVEYCVGGLWGTVCNYRWGDADAAVVCRQLGLNAHGT